PRGAPSSIGTGIIRRGALPDAPGGVPMFRALFSAFALTLALAASAQGVTDTPGVLGQSAAFTGPAMQLGKDMRDGALLYFNSINAKGGVNGRKIVLKALDDGYDPARASANTKKLIDDEKVF